MKTGLLSIAFLLYALSSFSQTNEWTWVSGDSLVNVRGVYGTKGISSTANKPGGRQESSNWIDNQGNLWLFGGYGYAASGGTGYLSDLWKYNTTTSQWTWISGDSTINKSAIYGNIGFPAMGNNPGGRSGMISYKDQSGNFWLFGGAGAGFMNDMWMYSIVTNEWTCLIGVGPRSYGVQGVPAPGNTPGTRDRAVGWVDHSNNFWLFGGCDDPSSGNSHCLNDLWEYNIADNEWTWIGGDTMETINGVYGMPGISTPANLPGSRSNAVSWTDNTGNLWLFGGQNDPSSGTRGLMNDLWQYNIATNEWAWVSGDTTVYNGGMYGTEDTAVAGNQPGSRATPTAWQTNSGNLWMFGGYGYSISWGNDFLSDLWNYNIGSGEWTWMSGVFWGNDLGDYGALRTPAQTNMPGSRWYSATWADNAGHLWLFGGYGYATAASVINGYLNDLWSFTASVAALIPTAQYSASVDTVCAGSAVSFTDQSTGSPVNWKWFFTGGTPDTSTTQNPMAVYNDSGTYAVKLVVSNSGGTDSLIKTAYITVLPAPVPVVTTTDSLICSGDSTQICATGGYNYVWNTSETSACIHASDAGGYWVTATGADGCAAVSGHQNIAVYSVPSVSIIVQGDTLSSFGATSYQWYFNGDSIPNAYGTVYIAIQPGNYAVEVTDTNGCKASSNSTYVSITGITEPAENNGLTIYPDPFTNIIFIKDDETGAIIQNIKIYDVLGRVALNNVYNNSAPLTFSLYLSALPPGAYYIRIETNQSLHVRSIIKD